MYCNPVLNRPSLEQGDPAVLEFAGYYYLYHTGRREVPVYRSTDLVNWEHLGTALRASDQPNHWAGIDLWAPEVIYANGRFYMYVSGARMVDGRGDDAVRRIGVAIADNPAGPFQLADQPLTDEWSIDSHPFLDSDGTWYMFYNVRNEHTVGPQGVIGCGNVVDRMLTFSSLEGRPSFVCKPEFPWEGNLEKDWYWNEGAFAFQRKGIYYQMYSGGCYYQPTYHIAYATAPVCRGPWGMADRSWQKWPNGQSEPILRSNQEVWGPEHHVVGRGPNGFHTYVIYHGHADSARERSNFIDRLAWRGNQIYVQGPSAHPKPGPWAPTLFLKEWLVDGLTLLADGECFGDFLWEGWLTCQHPITFGAVLDGEAAEFAVDFAITMSPQVGLRRPQANKGNILVPADEPLHWRLMRSGRQVEMWVNNLPCWQGTTASSLSALGVLSTQPVVLTGVRLTRGFSDILWDQPGVAGTALIASTVKNDLADWQTVRGSLVVEDQGARGKAAENIAVRKVDLSTFEMSVSVNGAAGLIPFFQDAKNYLRISWDPQKHVVILEGQGCCSGREEIVPLEANAHGWQHLQAWVNAERVSVLLNGQSIAERRLSETPSTRVGLWAQSDGLIDLVEVIDLAGVH